MARHPLDWAHFRTHDGHEWSTQLSCAADRPVLKGHNGWTIYKERVILVHAGIPRHVQNHIALHEFLHVAAGDDYNEHEEQLVTRMTGPLLHILQQFGFQLPDRPPGAEALEKRARREDK